MDKRHDLVIQSASEEYWQHTTEMAFVKDLNGVYLRASRSFAAMVGSPDPAELLGKTDADIFQDPELVKRYRDDDARLLQSGEAIENYVEPIVAQNGRPRYSVTSKYILKDETGAPVGIYGTGHDVTVEYEARQHYESELKSLFELPPDAPVAVLFDITAWRVVDVRYRNEADHVVSRYSQIDEYVANVIASIVDDKEAVRFFRSFSQRTIQDAYNQGVRNRSLEYLRRMPDGTERWVRDELHLLLDPVNGNLSLIIILRDIDSANREYYGLIQAAEQDSMTGLLHHDATIRCIERYLALAKGKQALFMIDLDNFKQFNDRFGHQHGDQILMNVAAAIKSTFRSSDIVGRLGGDEFMALMKNVRSEDAVRQKTDELIAALQFYSSGDGHDAELTTSIGLTIFTAGEATFSTLYSEADAALYQAKRAGKNRYCVFGSDQKKSGHGVPSPMLDSVSPIQLRTLLDYMDGGVVMAEVDESIHITYVSPSFYRSFSRNQEGLLASGKDVLSYVVEEDLPSLQAAVLEAAASNDLTDYAYRVVVQNGTEWRLIRIKRIPESNDGKRRVVAVITDISDLQRANDHLREAEQRYRIAAEQADAMLWEVDLSARTLTVKGANWKSHPYETAVYANAPDSYLATNAIHPDSVARFREMFDCIYSGDDDGAEYYFQILNDHGDEAWVKERYRMLRNDEGKPYCALGITQLVPNIGAEMRSFEHETQFADVVKASLFGFCRANLTRNLMESISLTDDPSSAYFEGLFYDLCVNNLCRERVHSDDRPGFLLAVSREYLMERFKIREGSRFIDYRRLCPDGEYRWASMFIKLMRHPISGDIYAFSYVRDNHLQRSWELSLGAPLSRNATLLLYTQEAMTALARNILTDCPPDSLVAVSVLELRGLGRIRSELGEPEASDILFTFGRLCRIAIDGAAVCGQLDENRATLLRVDAGSEEEQRKRATGKVSLLNRLLSEAHPEANVSIICGFAVDEARQASYSQLLRKADVACRSFSKVMGEAVVAYADAGVDSDSTDLFERWQALELRYQQQGNMLRLTENDELTGIPGKRAFCRRVREILDDGQEPPLCIIRFDINRFKVYNDVHGAASGDRLLRDISAFLRQLSAPALLVARLESDHFALLMRDDPDAVERFRSEFVTWLSDYAHDFHLSTTIGVYRITDPSLDVSLMCDRALLALHSVKSGFDARLAYYDDALRDRLLNEQQLVADMESALRDEQFELYFQPQVNYESGLLIGAEALVRWNHPTRGLLSPAVFIPLFEKNGLITRLDEYVWERCCNHIRRWTTRYPQAKGLSISVSVNVSRLDIYDPKLCETLRQMVERNGLPMSALRLEITESAYIENPQQLIETVRSLQAAGFVVEMDDFGSGYSSLNTLKDVAVDVLKLDMKFLAECADSARSGNILSSVIRMAHWLKLPIIAEGVETKAQADYLISLGCIYMQGYYFDRPMSAEDFESLLAKGAVSLDEQYRNTNVEGVAAFWDPSAQTTLLFNSFVGGAAIMEYRDGILEVLRVNNNFYQTLGTTREKYLPEQTNILEHFDNENRRRFVQELRRAIDTGEECGCETCCSTAIGGVTRPWTANRIRLLARNDDSAILYVSITDITERKLMEQEQEAENERNRILMETTGTSFFSYNYADDTLSYQGYLPEKGVVSRAIPNCSALPLDNPRLHPDSTEMLKRVIREGRHAHMNGELEFLADLWGKGMRWCRMRYASVEDAQGKVYRLVGQADDIQDIKESAALSEAVSHRLNATGRIHTFNGEVVTRIFDLFYDAADIHGAIVTTLSLLGEYFDLSYAYILEDSSDHLTVSNTFEWRAPGVKPQQELMQGVPYALMGGREAYVARFDENGSYYCRDISALSEEERMILEAHGVRSTLQYAIRDNGVFSGLIGFDQNKEDHIWTDEQAGTLMLICRIIASYLLKLRRSA